MTDLTIDDLTPKVVGDLKTVVGRTYNVLTSSYVSPGNVSVTMPVLKMKPVDIMRAPNIEGETSYIVGNSLREVASKFSSSVSASTGTGINMFSASISTEFKKETESTSEVGYCKVLHTVIKEKQGFAHGDDYKKYFLTGFKTDLEALDPEEFFKNYGTHLIKEAYFGGRLEFNFSKAKNMNESKESIKTNLEAGFSKIFSTKASTEFRKEVREVFENSEISSQVVGGTSLAISDLESFGKEYRKWVESLANKKNWEFCALPKHNGLVPLWEFCDKLDRKIELEECYIRLAKKLNKGLVEEELFVKDIQFVYHENEIQAKRSCPSGYILVEKDLNAGAGGDYIYLCYKLAKWDSKSQEAEERQLPITNISLIRNNKPLNSSEYSMKYDGLNYPFTRNGVDLNKGAKGEYIYSLFMCHPLFKPIKRLAVVFQDEEISTDEWDVVRWEGNGQAADCNKGAKGKYIYIYLKRDKSLGTLHHIITEEKAEEARKEAARIETARREALRIEEAIKRPARIDIRGSERVRRKVTRKDVNEKTEFDIVLKSVGSTKVSVIKIIREVTGKGLKEAKYLVDNIPSTIRQAVPKVEAEKIKAQLENIGATVELK